MASSIIWTLVLTGFTGLFAWQMYRRFKPLLKALPTPFVRVNRIPERIKHTLVYAIGQLKFFRGEQPAGVMHALVFWGFLILGGQVATMFLRGWAPDANLPLLAVDQLGGPYMLLRDLTEVVVCVTALGLLSRWLITHPHRLYGFKPAEEKISGASHVEALLILCFLAGLTMSGLA